MSYGLEMSNWKIYNLKDIAEVQTGPFGSQLHAHDYVFKGIPVIMPLNIINNKLEYEGIAQIREIDALRLKKHLVREGEIVFSRRGEIDRKALIKKENNGWFCGTGCLKVSPKKNLVNPTFLYYRLSTEDVKAWLYNHAVGATMPNLNTQILSNLPLDIPKIEIQQRIAYILSSFDDKIELNRRMNQTLEQMAQALFNHYFVDNIDPDNLPEEWSLFKIEDIADIIDCLHSKKPERVEINTDNILLQLENILDNGLLDLNNKFYITGEDYKKWISRIEVSFGDCVITNVGRSGVAARIPKGVKVAMGRNMTAIRLKKQFNYPAFLITLLTSDFLKAEINKNLDVGTILNALNVRSIPKLKFYFPINPIIIEDIEKQLAPIWLLMENNLFEVNKLSSIRDTLLPKLMSGEIDVSELNEEELKEDYVTENILNA